MAYSPASPPPSPDLWYGTSGPRDSRIAVVAESWGSHENAAKLPLVGPSGHLFDQILADAGLRRSQLFITNCFAARSSSLTVSQPSPLEMRSGASSTPDNPGFPNGKVSNQPNGRRAN